MGEAQVIYPAVLTHMMESIYADSKTRRAGGGPDLPKFPMRFSGRMTSEAVAIRGPDEFARDRRFIIEGKENQTVALQLRVRDGHITVTAAAKAMGINSTSWKRTWKSREGWERKKYYITG